MEPDGSSLWNQTYSYDQYDNLTKNGNPGTTWNPGYNTSNNRFIGGTYDGDGDVIYDGVNTYSWDAFGKMLGLRAGNSSPSCGTSGSFCATYDAAGRIVETSNGGTYREILYGPAGRLAQMNGQTVTEAIIPLPGGASLKATGAGGTGARIIQHVDWLGTARLGTSLLNRSMSYDAAYSPYGETYVSSGTVKQDFTGDLQDVFAGLFDTPNRELATNASRWLSPDPAGASWNAYSYPTDPNSVSDPSGAMDEAGQLLADLYHNLRSSQDFNGLFFSFDPISSGKGTTQGTSSTQAATNPAQQSTQSAQNKCRFWCKVGQALGFVETDEEKQAAAGQRDWINRNVRTADGKQLDIDKESDRQVTNLYNMIMLGMMMGRIPIAGSSGPGAPEYQTDPAQSPGPGWEWRGEGPVGSSEGSWYNAGTNESFHPDLSHPDPIGPHYDYRDALGNDYRVFPDGTVVPK